MRRYLYCLFLFFSWFFPYISHALQSVTVGDHKTYSRIVLRFEHAVSYNVIKRRGHHIIVEWHDKADIPLSKPLKRQKHIKSYKIIHKGDRKNIIINLFKKSDLKRVFHIPSLSHESYRLIIDIHKPLHSQSHKSSSSSQKTPKIMETFTSIETLSKHFATDSDYDASLDPIMPQCPVSLRQPLTLPDPMDQKLPLPKGSLLSLKPVIVIDPGHGGKDQGTSHFSLTEKEITLRYARSLQHLLNESGQYLAVLTRTDDVFVPLRERFLRAQEVGGHLLISFHVNYNPNSRIQGLSTYVLSSKARHHETDHLIQKDPKELQKYRYCQKPKRHIIQTSQKRVHEQALLFQTLLSRFIPKTHQHATMANAGDFAVLKACTIPSILIELGYISNGHDRKKLQSKDYENRILTRMLKAIHTYFDIEPIS